MAGAPAAAAGRNSAPTGTDARSLESVFAELEQQRQAALRAFWQTLLRCLLLLPVVVLPLAACLYTMLEAQPDTKSGALAQSGRLLMEPYAPEVFLGSLVWLLAGLILLGRLFVRKGRQPAWDYVRDFKLKVFNRLCDIHFPGLTYDPNGYVGYDEFDATRLFAYDSDQYLSHDYFSGRSGKTDISFAEVVARRERKRLEKGRVKTYYDEFFNGLVFIADFHKHFHSTTRLLPRGEKVARVRGQKPVVLEDPDFEETFRTLSTDQVDARYVLSSSMIARFVDLSRRFPGLRALFRDEKLVLALPTGRDLFEPSVYRPASSSRQTAQFVRDIDNLLSIVDELNLNTRIWSKV